MKKESTQEPRVLINKEPYQTPFYLTINQQKLEPVFEFLNLLHARGLSRKTLRAYAYDLLAFYRFLKETNLCIPHLTHHHLTDFILSQRRENAAPRTINRRMIVVKNFLNDQFEKLGERLFGKITTSVFYKGSRNKALLGNTWLKKKAERTFAVKVPSIIITPLSPAAIQKFLTGVRKYRDRAIVYLMLFCGLRVSEVLSLETGDIDFIDDQIRIHGKGQKERILPMPQSVRNTLQNYLDYERPHSHHNLCFAVLKGTSRGKPLSEAGLRNLFRYRKQISHVNQAHPHLFRHTFCTNLITQGVCLPIVQKLMGHTDIEVTLQYVHMSCHDVFKEYHQALKNLEQIYETQKT